MDVTQTVPAGNEVVGSTMAQGPSSTVANLPSRVVSQTVAPTTGQTVTVPVNHRKKPEKFNDLNFKSLADMLYNVYSTMKTAKELWESLDRKYKIEDAGAKKFIVGRFLELRIEEDNKSSEKKWFNPDVAKANVVEHGQSSKSYKNKFGPSSGKKTKHGPKGGISKKKFQGKCFNCDKVDHKSSECRMPKKKTKEANMVDYMAQDVSEINLAAVISEVNMVGSNPKEWWIDTGITRHVCFDKELFATFEAIENEEKLFMENSVTSEIKSQGKVVLKMTSGKESTLNNVLYGCLAKVAVPTPKKVQTFQTYTKTR
ncbi:uncharacterized protein LOC111381780 [Olea europaea var. sylvestris]|uniref:uncharacterized protein LOC111381780 n=1 Tax=Olea europaea var. sylvestris TaxID=158386 RepID=UPI000C1D3199|nr:uncharacterized protein LOC111381780 [Olea europaea var. sylvestris]